MGDDTDDSDVDHILQKPRASSTAGVMRPPSTSKQGESADNFEDDDLDF